MMNKFEKLDFLQELLFKSLDESQKNWVSERIQLLSGTCLAKDLHINFSLIPRQLGAKLLTASNNDYSKAVQINPFFTINGWTTDVVARLAMIVAYDKGNDIDYLKAVKPLFETADAKELETLFAGIYLLPYPELMKPLAFNAVRTNMTVAFNAMLYNNPYPHIFFDDLNWNQLIMKGVFNNQSLKEVIGLEQRRNQELARMAFDLLAERWVAQRDVSVYLWKLLPGYIDDSRKEMFVRVFDEGSVKHKYAALSALIEDNSDIANDILSSFNSVKDEYYLRSPDLEELHSWPY